jgi:hypothetical protein
MPETGSTASWADPAAESWRVRARATSRLAVRRAADGFGFGQLTGSHNTDQIRHDIELVTLSPDERGVDRPTVSGNHDSRIETEQAVECPRPFHRMGVGADRRRRALLDQITGKDHGLVAHIDDHVVVGVTPTQMRQRDAATAEVDRDLVDQHVGRLYRSGGTQRRGRCQVATLGVVTKPPLAHLLGALGDDRAAALMGPDGAGQEGGGPEEVVPV